MSRAAKIVWLALLAVILMASIAGAQQRFPPPEFENGYQLPATATPPTRAPWLQYVDLAVLAACLAAALWFVYHRRSRRGIFWLSLFSLAYFGFYRKGCICPIGSPQNIAYALFQPGYAAPLTVIGFFALPLLVALFFGRAFCAGVCPQGALQDLVLIKPLNVPPWLEQGLGIIPFLFLGAGLAYAATGTGFVICRFDPFVPIFRLSGSFFILTAGALFLLVGMFVGRPYCRFLCPYGALLKSAAAVSKWRVRVTPDNCTQCKLCEGSCPFGAMREPTGTASRRPETGERARLGWLVVLLPALVASGVWAGAAFSPVAARLDPAVRLAELYTRQQANPAVYGALTPEALALGRAEQQPETVLAEARELRRRFRIATMLFGGWAGLVVGVKLIALSIRQKRVDFEPDQGACFGCARCFSACPNERARLGWLTPEPVK